MDSVKFGIGAVAVAALVLSVMAFTKTPPPTPTPKDPPFGAVTGTDVFNLTHYYDNVNVGGIDFATTSQGATTYTAASLAKPRVVEHIAGAALTVTFPTNANWSAVGFLPNVGDSQSFFVQASTTKITFVGNTGVTLDSASTSQVIYPGRIGKFECTRLGATEARLIHCFMLAD